MAKMIACLRTSQPLPRGLVSTRPRTMLIFWSFLLNGGTLRLCQAFLVKDTRLRTLSVDYLQESAKLKRELKEAAKNVPFSWIFGR
ncbi:unnamed protein product [Brassica rapa]|nr:unnamed protein product [Brassica napus]CAG7890957.1 unnamed protein product [Brassica rapa]CDY68055.1 BnaAnng26040D [Brassica napus]VDD27434.1 unnamed protein product [Brassica rapa]